MRPLLIGILPIFQYIPPQEFTVQLDTGSGDFWVVDSACGQKGCYNGCTSNEAQWCNAQCDPECCGQNDGGGKTTMTATKPVPTVTPAAFVMPRRKSHRRAKIYPNLKAKNPLHTKRRT
ncbi:hypothetical protein niasHT_006367 [Heterodera trifolii]|uniref:Peptidase A1 domain-containing protein n=1 Tax=Heterodera trifolii TaxID=157864 RepID=A0ABD2M1R2_9BILA